MDKKGLKVQEKQMIPGIGVAGQVMCPLSMMAPKMCLKGGCESWVELNYEGTPVGRCTFSWMSILAVEIRQAIDRLGAPGKKEKPPK